MVRVLKIAVEWIVGGRLPCNRKLWRNGELGGGGGGRHKNLNFPLFRSPGVLHVALEWITGGRLPPNQVNLSHFQAVMFERENLVVVAACG